MFGGVNGLVLACLVQWTRSRLAFGAVAAVASGLCAVPTAAVVSGGWQHVFVAGSGAPVFVCWCMLLGAVLGPILPGSVGARGNDPGRVVGPGAVIGAIVGLARWGCRSGVLR